MNRARDARGFKNARGLGRILHGNGPRASVAKLITAKTPAKWYNSTLKSRAGNNIDLRLIRFGVHKENLI